MGRKKKKSRRRELELFKEDNTVQEFENSMRNHGIKTKSKVGKKMEKRLQKMEQRKRHMKKYDVKLEEAERLGFHKVTACFKGELAIDKQFLLSSIKNYVDEPFQAFGNFITENSVSFYIDANKGIAEAIRSLSKKIQSSSGQVITLKVDYVSETDFILNCDQIELLKKVIFQRYSQDSGLLNLSCLHLDNAFMESNTFAPLANQRIFKQVITFIKDTLPSLNALDLSHNKLDDSCLEPLKTLTTHSLNISAINFENNNLRKLRLLESLRLFPLKELKLLNNNYSERKGSSNAFIKMVKKILPFLKILDGCDLSEIALHPNNAKFISFNVASTKPLVKSTTEISVSEENMRTFLEQYFSLLDTSEKGALIQAYVPTAKLELNSQNPLIPSKIFDGHIEIQEFLNSWPESKHDHSSFQLEILNLSSTEGVCKIEGVCGFVQNGVTVKFNRVMKIVPYNAGFCCVADMLCIL
ncbi:UNVERIFIED_CONTAM: hypothetical protein RMT77_017247 [Armadillidium vulgare]